MTIRDDGTIELSFSLGDMRGLPVTAYLTLTSQSAAALADQLLRAVACADQFVAKKADAV